MKNRKGEIATLLTLGLVLVGGLVTLATSFFVNKQKNLASNPKAAAVNCIYSQSECSVMARAGECPSGYISSSCTRCNNGQYRCPGTTDDSVVASTPKPPTPTPTKVGSGNRFNPDPTQGYNTKLCSSEGLPFACCVQDGYQCNGEKRYRWYGCTGQPCENTKISQSNGPGHLVGCPGGFDPGKKVEVCESELTPTPTSGPSRGTRNGFCYSPYSNPNRPGVSGWTCNSPYVCSSQSSSGKCISSSATPVPTLITFNPGGGTIPASSDDLVTPVDEGENFTCEPKTCPANTTGGPYYRRAGTNEYFVTESECKAPASGQAEEAIKNLACESTQVELVASNKCTDQECPSPNKGIFYSYKCTGVPQIIGGVTQCPSYSFYAGKGCATIRTTLSQDNVQQNYCNANYTDTSAKRNVTISYTVNQTGAINISTTDPTITLHISNNYGLGLFTVSLKIGTTNFPASGSKSIDTGTNLIRANLTYVNDKNQSVNLPCGSANVVNSEATISCDIK